MDGRITDLGELEHEVMQLVWSGGEVTADAIRLRLDRKPKESTVRTVLRRLEEKGYVTHTTSGRTFTATREGDQLFMQVTGFGRYPVYPYTDKDFFATIKPIQMSFVSDGKSKATQLIRHQFGIEAVLNRVD